MRFVKVLISLSLVATLAFAFVRPVHADPHAVFFTVVGQQQLFFNVLAALNQADYVESLDLRNQLAQKRDAAGYVPSSAAALKESQTNLADLLTRDVTLEGQDVRTQERSDQYARQVVGERRAADLIEKLCEEAFGSKNCQVDVNNPDTNLLEERDKAFIQDPLRYSQLPVELGALAALSSGTDEHNQQAEDILNQPTNGGPTLPFAYSPEIADLRSKLQKAPQAVRDKFEEIVKTVEAQYQPQVFDTEVWEKKLKAAAQTKEVTLQESNQDSSAPNATRPEQIIRDHARAIDEALDIQNDLLTIADAAQDRVATQLEGTLVDGAIPDRIHKVAEGVDPSQPGEIGTLVSAPANVKVGLQQQLLPLLAQLEANPQFADPAQVDNPNGGELAVDRQGKPPLKVGAPLQTFSANNVITKGLLPQTGVTDKAGLAGLNLLQSFLKQLAGKL